MATTHANSYEEIDGAEVAAVASIDDNLEEFVPENAPGAATYDDAETMLADADVTMVDVCTPTPTHRPLVRAAAERDLAIFCEKPMARTIDGADEMVEVIDETGVPFMVGHVLRYFPSYVTAKELIDAGEIGRPGTLRAERLSPPPTYATDNWLVDPEQSGGVLLDMAIHDFDYLRWVGGEVERVFTRSARWEDEQLHEHAGVDLRFEDGTVGYVEASWGYPGDMPFTTAFEFSGDEGSLEYDTREENAVRFYGDNDAAATPAQSAYEKSPYTRELEHFIDCVETGAEPDIGAREAREAVRLSLAAIESRERDEPVRVSEVGA